MTLRMGKKAWLGVLFAVVVSANFARMLMHLCSPAAPDDVPPNNQPAGRQSAAADVAKTKSPAEWLTHLRQLPADQRKLLLDEVVGAEDYRPADKAENFLWAAGTIQPRSMSEIVCLMRPESPNESAAWYRWIVPDRAQVKMGDRLIECDDGQVKQRLKDQATLVAKTEQLLRLETAALKRVQSDEAARVNLARAELKLAQQALKRYTGADAALQERLQMAVAAAEESLKEVKNMADVRTGQADSQRQAKQDLLDRARGHLRYLEEDLAACVLYAPRDGQVVHCSRLPPQGRLSHGQKILWVCDLADVRLTARIDEAKQPEAALVRSGQQAYIRIGDLPSRGVVGRVARQDLGVIAVEVEFVKEKSTGKDNLGTLLPDTAAKALIVIDGSPGRLLVPFAAVLGSETEKFCFVLQGKDLCDRPVRTGKESRQGVEIALGLQENDLVLTDPAAAIRRLVAARGVGKEK